MKRIILILLLTMAFSLSYSTEKPWTFWYWMYGAVSKEGIKADLQAMKDVGLGGCYLMPIRGITDKPEYDGDTQQLTPRFWEMVDYAMQQGDSLRLGLGIHVCDGFALAGGPWISPAESMQKVVWSDTLVTITHDGQTLSLPQPAEGYQGYYEDIAAFAIPAEPPLPHPHESGTIIRNEYGVFRSKEAGYIQYDFDEPQTVRSMEVIPSGNNLQSQRLLVQASDDGVTFHDVRQLAPPRQGWQNTDAHYTYALPETYARHFRFFWTPEGTEPGSEDLDAAKWSAVLKTQDIILSAESRIDQYEAKNGSVWRIARKDSGSSDSSSPSISRTSRTSRLSSIPRIPIEPDFLSLPLGTWRIIRFGHTSTGHTNATAGGGKGLECDKFSEEAVNKQIDHWFGEFMKRPHANVVKYMHIDSWECGSQNWSKNFAEEFKKRRGYDLLPYLPVYAGIPMENAEQVLHDIRHTINDLIHDVFFSTIKRRAEQYHVMLSAESIAPTMVADGMEHYRYADIPMGEFWLNSPTHDKPNDMMDAISGAHIYGKNIVQAEGFTEVRGVWNETPAMIKPLIDRNFALGMNRLFFHVFTHNPWMDKKPGMTLDGIGLFFQRDQTWFPEAKPFVEYITRCQTLLQEGNPVADIAVYTGEEMPRRALTPDRLVTMLPGLFGQERVNKERLRLANEGNPMEESPVGVNHSANILDLKDWTNALHGYQYDSMNKDALLSQPFRYGALVIPEECLVSDETRARIDQLQAQGVYIIDKPYLSPTLPNILPDVILPEGIAYTHRQGLDREIYFLANQQDKTCHFTATFRNGDCQPIVFDPVTNEYFSPECQDSTYHDIPLSLEPYQSVFVLYDKTRSLQYGNKHYTIRKQTLYDTETIDKRYDITFRENGLTFKKQQLFDWSQHPDDRIRYFSGHALYTTTFKHKGKPTGKTWLCVPNVKDIAHVWVNGIDCGIAWTAPYEVNITKALKKGNNLLEIEVVNTWHNALRGADRGKSPYVGIWTNAKYRSKGDGLLPAGLLEPITLKIDN